MFFNWPNSFWDMTKRLKQLSCKLKKQQCSRCSATCRAQRADTFFVNNYIQLYVWGLVAVNYIIWHRRKRCFGGNACDFLAYIKFWLWDFLKITAAPLDVWEDIKSRHIVGHSRTDKSDIVLRQSFLIN
jgi:hypothetical protein